MIKIQGLTFIVIKIIHFKCNARLTAYPLKLFLIKYELDINVYN